MAETKIGLHLEGSDEDISTLETFLKGDKQLSFPELIALLSRITVVKATLLDEMVIYPK